MRIHCFLIFTFLSFCLIGQESLSDLQHRVDSLERAKNWEAYLETALQITQYWYGQDQVDKAISEAQNFLKKGTSHLTAPSPALGALYHKLGVYYYVESDYDQAQKAYEEAIEVRRKALDPNAPELSRSLHNMGVALKEKGNYPSAIDYLLQAVGIRKKLSDESLLATTYQELGIVYSREGDYRHSLDYSQAALRLYEQTEEGPTYDKARTYQATGIVYRRMEQFPKALEQLEQALPYFIQLYGKEDSDVADCYNNLGNVYDDLGDFPKALKNYQQSLQLNRLIFGESHDKVAQNYNNLGYTYTRLKKYDLALSSLGKSLQIREKLWGENHPALGPIYHNIGDVEALLGNFDQALKYYQLAIVNSFSDFRDLEVSAQPELDKHQLWGSSMDLLGFLRSKAELLQQKYANTGQIIELKIALDTYHTCDKLLDYIRMRYESTESKLFLLENAIPLYEGALEVTFELYQTSGGPAYLDQAFHFMEKSKGVLLLAGIREDRARLYAHIPDSLLHKENDLRADIAYFEKKLAELPKDHMETGELKDRFLATKQDHKKLVQTLERDFPAYYQEKYRMETVNMAALQEFLQNRHTGLVAYFCGEENLFIFTLARGEKSLHKVPLAISLTEKVNSLLTEISSYSNDPNNFQQASYDLYDLLWRPLPDDLPERLVIIPAGVLGYIPFEVLLASVNGTNGTPALVARSYLMRFHQLNYAYSASVFLENQGEEHPKAKRNFLGVAPVFSQSSTYAYLDHSKREVAHIRKLLGGDLMVGPRATKTRFQSEAGRYRILHISSHAKVVNSNSLLSWIAFSEEEGKEDHKLVLSEIYALPIQKAEMVVLSACETGRGQLSEGEGIMSLARGFAYAGCQSVTTSLWAVNHESTNRIMASYYQGLKEGLPKDEALRQAKLNYLDSGQTDQPGAHPYYWSAFIHIGDNSALDLESRWYKWWWPVIALVLIIVFRWWLRRRKK